ncbi:TPM domain-containing protein [Niabella ginsengisoli]|uniref:TPM domain-containing protein n=1 Tax=Niabella ginsengisoli TaxID=522298 RepID=A0ABS9SGF7_9BACT|nr:TPM domain-containing protein [Niabella ginsengisoli]MCH5597434.1 TPM domain-containing protein [Niabella ginsengisoli]
MKKLILLFLLFVSVFANAQIENAVPAPSNPPKLVNDFTGGFLTHEQQDALEKKLVAYDDSTSNQIAVVIVDELKGYSRDEYAIALGRKWGVGGQKEFSNGVVILVNTGEKGDQRGVFIATGYGLEGVITDLVADQIVQHALLSNFRQGNNYRGLDQATTDIMDAASGRYSAPEGYGQSRKGGKVSGLLLAGFIIIIIIIIISRRGGGGGGGYVSRRGYRGGWNGPVIFPGGWGGGGNSGGGGWSGGGGFGGFGGGGFGGGGAGGSW